MKNLLYISCFTITLAFSGLANATTQSVSKQEMKLIVSAICSIDEDYSNEEVQEAIKEVSFEQIDEDMADSRVNELADVAMTMQMMPGNVEVLCSQPIY